MLRHLELYDSTTRRQQRERKKQQKVSVGKQQLCTCISLLCTFLCRFCPTTKRNCLILLFREDVSNGRRNFILFLKLEYSMDNRKNIVMNIVLRNSTPGGFAYINFDKVSWNNGDKDRKNTNSFLKRSFRCCHVVRS